MIETTEDSAELEQLKAILERLPDGVVTVTDAGDVVHANLAAKRLFHPATLRLGEPLPAVWGEFSLSPFVARLFRRGTATISEEIHSSKGRVYTVVGIGAGKATTAVMMLEDVTARAHRAEAQREFVSNAAHELLTPLTGIVGAAHALESGAKVVPETRDRFIAHIARECDRLARIARALLILARARSGEEPPRLDVIELHPLILDALHAADAGDEVEVRCDVTLRVFVDRDLAEQALINLVGNARRHALGEPVLISAREGPGRKVEIEIADRGAGMAAEQLDRLQRRFATGTGRDSAGFGLGLSIAAQLLEAMGGTLSFDSTPGEGTRALVELPSAQVGRP